MDNPSPLPQLALTSEQQLILQAHAAEAIAELVNLQFSGDPVKDQLQIYAYVHAKAKFEAYTGLQKYDQEVLAAAKQELAAQVQTQTQGE